MSTERPAGLAAITEDAEDADYGWRVLTVCTANVSRSPLAAECFRKHLRAAGIPAVVRSAGTMATKLEVDGEMVRAGWERGVDIADHAPRRLTTEILAAEGRDLVVALSREHLREIVALDEATLSRTFTLKDLVRRCEAARARLRTEPEAWLDILGEGRDLRALIGDDSDDDVTDPYRRSLETHRLVAGEIDDLVRRVSGGLFDFISE